MDLTPQEKRVIDNFVSTMGGLTLDEALGNAELDALAYGLSRAATRELGVRIRAAFARRVRP